MVRTGSGSVRCGKEFSTVVPSPAVCWAIAISTIFLFIASSLRHALFHSNALDLGIFDQPLYLLSRGLPPISTIIGIHILGDHAAWIFYPLSLLYRLYPDVHWLFAVQAIALSTGALPTWHLARQAGLQERQATAIAIVYLFYPLIFNLNLFDFHPEVIALPLFLTAVLAARADQIGWFTFCVTIILGCRDALSLTIAAMGVWLFFFEKQKRCGAIAFFSGISWFLLATQVIVPYFQPAGVFGVTHFSEFGKTIPEILLNLALRPDLLLRQLLTLPNFEYAALLLCPLIWGLSYRHLTPLIAAVPQLSINLLSSNNGLKNLVHQYSLPILPFLILAVISAVAAHQTWLYRPRRMVLWSLIAFVALSKLPLFATGYLSTLNTWQASRTAISQITTKGAVLAPAALVPHVSHREMVKVVGSYEGVNLNDYDYLLLNQRNPGKLSTPEIVTRFIADAAQHPQFQLRYQQDGVYLFSHTRLLSGGS